jgi:hypothetical protein
MRQLSIVNYGGTRFIASGSSVNVNVTDSVWHKKGRDDNLILITTLTHNKQVTICQFAYLKA